MDSSLNVQKISGIFSAIGFFLLVLILPISVSEITTTTMKNYNSYSETAYYYEWIYSKGFLAFFVILLIALGTVFSVIDFIKAEDNPYESTKFFILSIVFTALGVGFYIGAAFTPTTITTSATVQSAEVNFTTASWMMYMSDTIAFFMLIDKIVYRNTCLKVLARVERSRKRNSSANNYNPIASLQKTADPYCCPICHAEVYSATSRLCNKCGNVFEHPVKRSELNKPQTPTTNKNENPSSVTVLNAADKKATIEIKNDDNSENAVLKLKQLKELFDSGIITEEEYNEKKSKYLKYF